MRERLAPTDSEDNAKEFKLLQEGLPQKPFSLESEKECSFDGIPSQPNFKEANKCLYPEPNEKKQVASEAEKPAT